VKELLEEEYRRFVQEGVSEEHPDPLMVAREYDDEKIALLCALFSYGSAKQIVKFLRRLDFSLLYEKDESILSLDVSYRFQTSHDVAQIFMTLKRAHNLNEIFLQGYRAEGSVMDGLRELIDHLRSLNPYRSYGYDFLLGRTPPKDRLIAVAPYKRWHMFLRWVVRDTDIDLGLWRGVKKADLIIPLDTHTFGVGRRLGLLRRKRYDLAAALELTQSLREFDPHDPIKYDFALYRLGQRNLV